MTGCEPPFGRITKLVNGYWIVPSIERDRKVFVKTAETESLYDGPELFLREDGTFQDKSRCRPLWYFDSVEEAELGLAAALLSQGG